MVKMISVRGSAKNFALPVITSLRRLLETVISSALFSKKRCSANAKQFGVNSNHLKLFFKYFGVFVVWFKS